MQNNQPPIERIAFALKAERQKQEVSIGEVARRANIAKSTLSQLENGIGNPSIDTLWSLCMALDIPVSQLLAEPKSQIKVIRYGEGNAVVKDNRDYRATLLAASPKNVSRDVYWIEVAKGDPCLSEAHHNGVVEHLVLVSGKARLGPVNDTFVLNEGDYICYPADEPHVFEALAEGTRALLISEYR